MSRKFIALHLALLALAGVLGWQLRLRWLNANEKEREMLARQVAAKKTLAPALPTPPRPAAPAEYLEVAQRTLFSKDRNPNVVVVVEAPKPVPEVPMPALPRYYGQMGFGEPVALLSVSNGPQKGYRAGETVGDFKLAAFDRETIELEWKGKTVQKKLEELAVKEAAPPAPGAQPAGQGSPAAPPRTGASEARPAAATVTSLGASSNASGNVVSDHGNLPSAIGPENAGGSRECVANDSSPAGTILSGYKKTVIKFMLGEVCRWEQVK